MTFMKQHGIDRGTAVLKDDLIERITGTNGIEVTGKFGGLDTKKRKTRTTKRSHGTTKTGKTKGTQKEGQGATGS